MSDRLVDVEGIGQAYSATLAEHGLTTTDDLLTRGARPGDRAALAATTGIDTGLILEWVNHADLFRVRGVAGQFADLLEEAGVDTVVELARRNPGNLATALAEANAAKNLANRVPSLSEVEDWVAQAVVLPRAVFYDEAGAGAPGVAAGPSGAKLEAPVVPQTQRVRTVATMAPLVDGGKGRGRWERLMDRIRGT